MMAIGLILFSIGAICSVCTNPYSDWYVLWALIVLIGIILLVTGGSVWLWRFAP